jgi:DNA-binding beta-propeller fold protein YncE
MPQTDQGRPKGMCRDPHGNILLVEPHYSRVNQFDSSGRLLSQFGNHGTNSGELAFPRAVAVNSKGTVFVSEYGVVERIQFFDLATKEFLGSLGVAGVKPGEFNRPEGIFVDHLDRLYVCDSCNHRIQVFSADGKWKTLYGGAGTEAGQLSYPYDIQVDSEGVQFVCEFGNSRIQVFDRDHKPVEIIGTTGRNAGEFNNPTGLALDSKGNLYVADAMNHRVQKFLRKTPLRHEINLTSNLVKPEKGVAQESTDERSSPTP